MGYGRGMEVLVLGGTGMLGHALWYGLKDRHKVTVTLRRDIASLRESCALFHVDEVRFVELGDVLDLAALAGVYHVGSDPINRYDLLCRIKGALGLSVEIEPDDAVVVDRSLTSRRFWAATGLPTPSWDEMIDELARRGPAYAA